MYQVLGLNLGGTHAASQVNIKSNMLKDLYQFFFQYCVLTGMIKDIRYLCKSNSNDINKLIFIYNSLILF